VTLIISSCTGKVEPVFSPVNDTPLCLRGAGTLLFFCSSEKNPPPFPLYHLGDSKAGTKMFFSAIEIGLMIARGSSSPVFFRLRNPSRSFFFFPFCPHIFLAYYSPCEAKSTPSASIYIFPQPGVENRLLFFPFCSNRGYVNLAYLLRAKRIGSSFPPRPSKRASFSFFFFFC